MEPVFRPFGPRFRTLPTFVARSFRNFKASMRFIRLKPQIAGFGSQRMCPSCGLITSRSKAASGGVPRVKNMQGNKSVIVIRMVVALLILYAVFGLIRKTLPAPAVGNGTGTHQASS